MSRILSDAASKHFTFADLICGDTVSRSFIRADLLPQQPETWQMLAGLAQHVLDPLVEHFGQVELTYGFAPPQVTAHIEAKARRRRREGVIVPVGSSTRIAPQLDQHASCELNRHGERVCKRGGAAVDLRVPDYDSDAVARWCIDRLPIDRLYYYGADRSLHLSWHPAPSRAFFKMVRGPSGRLLPRPFSDVLF